MTLELKNIEMGHVCDFCWDGDSSTCPGRYSDITPPHEQDPCPSCVREACGQHVHYFGEVVGKWECRVCDGTVIYTWPRPEVLTSVRFCTLCAYNGLWAEELDQKVLDKELFLVMCLEGSVICALCWVRMHKRFHPRCTEWRTAEALLVADALVKMEE